MTLGCQKCFCKFGLLVFAIDISQGENDAKISRKVFPKKKTKAKKNQSPDVSFTSLCFLLNGS